MGAGKGKSRVAAIIGLFSLALSLTRKVCFIYPNAYLKYREEKQFKDILEHFHPPRKPNAQQASLIVQLKWLTWKEFVQ
jgi:hypothetical protein